MNGWSNKETWLVNLWLGDFLSEEQEHGITIDAAYVEQMVDEMASAVLDNPDSNGLITDMLNSALGRVNYWELGEHYDNSIEEDSK